MASSVVEFAVLVRVIRPLPSALAASLVFSAFAVLALLVILTLIAMFAWFGLVAIVVPSIKSNIQSFDCLLELCREGFRFGCGIGRFLRRFVSCCVDSDLSVQLLCGHLLELRTFGIDERLPFVTRRLIRHEGIEKFENNDGFCEIGCVRRLIVINLVDELFKSIDVVIDGRLIVLLEQGKVVGGSDILEIRGSAIFVTKSFPDCRRIVLNIDQFEEFRIGKSANNCFSCTFMVILPFADSGAQGRWNWTRRAVRIARHRIRIGPIDDTEDLVELERCFGSDLPYFEFIGFEIAKCDLLDVGCVFCH